MDTHSYDRMHPPLLLIDIRPASQQTAELQTARNEPSRNDSPLPCAHVPRLHFRTAGNRR